MAQIQLMFLSNSMVIQNAHFQFPWLYKVWDSQQIQFSDMCKLYKRAVLSDFHEIEQPNMFCLLK